MGFYCTWNENLWKNLSFGIKLLLCIDELTWHKALILWSSVLLTSSAYKLANYIYIVQYICVCTRVFVCVHKLTQLTIIILDFDECATGVHNCKFNERCVNKPGRFVCRCLDGYKSVNNVCEGMLVNHWVDQLYI